MTAIPLLQLALDFISLPAALAIAVKVADEVDVIEIGTPLCKAAGLEAIRAVREVCPDKLILADLKSPDVGGLEAQMAFDAGADMMTVIGGAALATVESALRVAQDMGKEMLMELTGVRDIIARAEEWREIGVERMVYHRGWDEQIFDRQWQPEDLVVDSPAHRHGLQDHRHRRHHRSTCFPFSKTCPCRSLSSDGPSTRPRTRQLRRARSGQTSHRLWGGRADLTGGSSFVDTAAMAIRFGVSDMGLLLTVDGRDCPGCDSPQRFCQGTRTSIHCPPAYNAGSLCRLSDRFLARATLLAANRPVSFFSIRRSSHASVGQPGHRPVASHGQCPGATGLSQVDVNAGVAAADRCWGVEHGRNHASEIKTVALVGG